MIPLAIGITIGITLLFLYIKSRSTSDKIRSKITGKSVKRVTFLAQFLTKFSIKQHPVFFYLSIRQVFGQNFVIWHLFDNVLVLCEKVLMKIVLMDTSRFRAARFRGMPLLNYYYGDSNLFEESMGEDFDVSEFVKFGSRDLGSVNSGDRLGEVFFQNLAVNVVWKYFFGGELLDEIERFRVISSQLGSVIRNDFPPLQVIQMINNHGFKRHVETLRSSIRGYIASDQSGRNTITSQLVAFHGVNCVNLIMESLFKCYKSVYLTLMYTLYNSCRFPEAQDRIRREVRKNEPFFENEKYSRHMILETINLFPPFPLGEPRECIKEGFVSHLYIPKGIKVIPNIYVLNSDNFEYNNLRKKRERPFGLGFIKPELENLTVNMTEELLESILSKYKISLPEDFQLRYKTKSLCLEPLTLSFIFKQL
eukprot:TRINITY_DN5379_c0_g1_i1.p1 TRINITY_DN5379_c0_g1~~TRINITY_DN5379_c0_g1_i1.p1  ORF type:complete len:433 (+),score=89.94 TRINITY_DN5379_c0_g1_i1:34-1299(+)